MTAGLEAMMIRQSNQITAIYTRIDYPGNSKCIQRQKDILSRYAEEKGLPNIEFYSDSGYSGVTADRPDFKRLLANIEQGKIENIVVHRIDRLYRDYLSTCQLVDDLLPKHHVSLYAVRDGITPETPWLSFSEQLLAAMGGGR